jgi:hypothetical protein
LRGTSWPKPQETGFRVTRQSKIDKSLGAFLRGQKGTQCSRFLVPRCDVHDLKTPERVRLKLSLPS